MNAQARSNLAGVVSHTLAQLALQPATAPNLHGPAQQVNRFNDKPQLVGKVGARGAGFAYCLFPALACDGAAADQPYQSSHAHYHFDAREAALLAKLRECYAERNCTSMGGSNQYLRRICDVRPGVFFDCLCRVVAVDDSDAALHLLHIWDDSDALPFPATWVAWGRGRGARARGSMLEQRRASACIGRRPACLPVSWHGRLPTSCTHPAHLKLMQPTFGVYLPLCCAAGSTLGSRSLQACCATRPWTCSDSTSNCAPLRCPCRCAGLGPTG